METPRRFWPTHLLVRTASATDAEMKVLYDEIARQRLQRMTHNAATLFNGGHLREGITLDYAAEVLWTYSSPDLYSLLVVERGWPLEQSDWIQLGVADEKKEAADGTVEARDRASDNPVGGWDGLRSGCRGRFGMYLPPLLGPRSR